MNAREYLQQVKRMYLEIQNQELELAMLKSKPTDIGIKISDEAVKTSGPSDKIGNIVSTYCDFEAELNQSKKQYAALVEEVKQTIKQVSNADAYDILYKKYILFLDWREIARMKGFTYQYVCGKLLTKGLDEVQKILNCQV